MLELLGESMALGRTPPCSKHRARSSPPTIQNMSNPRSASIDINRCEGAFSAFGDTSLPEVLIEIWSLCSCRFCSKRFLLSELDHTGSESTDEGRTLAIQCPHSCSVNKDELVGHQDRLRKRLPTPAISRWIAEEPPTLDELFLARRPAVGQPEQPGYFTPDVAQVRNI